MKQTCDRLVLGFILISFILGLALASSAFAFDYTSITFGQTSSAKTSAPNVRVAVQYPHVAKDQAGNVVQGFAPNAIYNYYLTKSTTHTFSGNVTAYEVQADQDTKLYLGSDLTNYILLYANTPRIFVRN